MSHEAPRRYLIAYDIPDDKRRARVAKKLEEYGDRAQYSVFIVDGRPAKILRLRAALELLIERDVDSLLFCDLGTSPRTTSLEFVGCRRRITSDGPAVV